MVEEVEVVLCGLTVALGEDHGKCVHSCVGLSDEDRIVPLGVDLEEAWEALE